MSSSQNAAHAAPTLVNECAAPVRGVAHATPALEVDVPMHNNVGQGLIPTTLNPVEIAIPSSMLTISDDTAKMFDNLKNIEKQTETVAILTKRMMETPLREPPMVEPPVVESDRASAKRRRRTRYHPVAWDHGKCTWLQARGRQRDAPDFVDGVRDGNRGGRLASPYPFLGAASYKSCMAGNRTHFLRICMHRVTFHLSFVLSACRREIPPVLRLRARHVHGDPDGFVPVHLGTLDRQCDGL